MWGADDEDSKTPLRADLVEAGINLTKCFEGTLSLSENGKTYELAKDHLSLPIKRFPGLALPCSFLFLRRSPITSCIFMILHFTCFVIGENPRALVFYVPKLENEEEAAYIHKMIAAARKAAEGFASFLIGWARARVLIILENPRAILRAHEIMDALYPYFAGASLGWHDYLASTVARIFPKTATTWIPG